MAPKARDIDLEVVKRLLAQGHTRRQIAQDLQIPESTLRHRLQGLPQVHQGRPSDNPAPGPPEGDQSIPSSPPTGIPQEDKGIPSLLPPESPPEEHQGIPMPFVGEHEEYPGLPTQGIPEGDQGRPPLHTGTHPPEVYQGTPQETLSPQLAQDLTAAWPELQALLAWWRERQQLAQTPAEKLERVTYHVAPQWIAAVKREADLTGESYAAIVARAFARYFAERDTSGIP